MNRMTKELTANEKKALELYVEHTALDLTEQFEQEAVNIAPLLQIVSRKRHSLLNHDNMQHIQLWRHKVSGNRYVIVVRSRLRIANSPRIVKELCTTLFPAAQKISLRSRLNRANPDLVSLYNYAEAVIKNSKKRESLLDSLGGLLSIFRVPAEQQPEAPHQGAVFGGGPTGVTLEAGLAQEEKEEELAAAAAPELDGHALNEPDYDIYSPSEGQTEKIEQMEQSEEGEEATTVEDCCDIMNDSSMEDELIFIANVDDSLFFSFP